MIAKLLGKLSFSHYGAYGEHEWTGTPATTGPDAYRRAPPGARRLLATLPRTSAWTGTRVRDDLMGRMNEPPRLLLVAAGHAGMGGGGGVCGLRQCDRS